MINFKNLAEKKVTIMGLGLHGGGLGAARFFANSGADVTVTDLKTKEDLGSSLLKLKGLPIRYVLGHHDKKDFQEADIVIKNPAVPDDSEFLTAARESGAAIETDLSIFFRLKTRPVIGITGTKGKSTTTTLIYEILSKSHPGTFLGGNIGVSLLDGLIETSAPAVLELSSWQLEGLEIVKKSPEIAALTDFFPDHLDRHKTMENYFEAKKNIYRYQKTEDAVIFNIDNDQLRRESESWKNSRVFAVSLKRETTGGFLKDSALFLNINGSPQKLIDIDQVQLLGRHNLTNILLAAVAASLAGAPLDDIRTTIQNFKGVENRLEFIRKFQGVDYYNDTTSTVPDATSAALKSFDRPIVLIAGGQAKGVGFEKLAQDIASSVKKLIIFDTPDARLLTDKIKKINPDFPIISAKNMRSAVRKSQKESARHDIVLLSPAFASFGLFRNEFDRGQQFKTCVLALK